MPPQQDPIMRLNQAPEKRSALRVISWQQLQTHNNQSSCWMVIHRNVYDVTPFLSSHPGGIDRLVVASGARDATWLFESCHPIKTRALLRKFHIGTLKGSPMPDDALSRDELSDTATVFNDTSPFYEEVKTRCEAELKRRGVTQQQDHWQTHARIGVVFSLLFLFYYLIHFSNLSLPSRLCFCALQGLLHTQLFLFGHEANHGNITRNPFLRTLLSFSWDAMGHAHAVEWQLHSIAHHSYVGGGEWDPDDNWCYGLLRTRNSDPFRPFHRYQHLYCWVLYGFFSMVRYFNQWIIPLSGKFRKFAVRSPSTLQLFVFYLSKIAFFYYMIGFPAQYSSLLETCLCSFVVMYVSGWLLCFFTYYPHTVELRDGFVTHCTRVSARENDFAIYQVENSTSYGHARSYVFWFMTHWECYHTEHHLFPYLNPHHCRIISRTVRQVCAEFGVHYNWIPSISEFIAAQFRYWKRMGTERIQEGVGEERKNE